MANFCIRSRSHNFPLFHDDNLISKWRELDSMRRHDNSLPLQVIQYGVLDYLLSYVHIHSTDNVIKQQNIPVGVQ